MVLRKLYGETDMMTTNPQDFDVKQVVLYDGTFGPREIEQLFAVSSRDFNQFEVLKNSVQELESKSQDLSPAGYVRLGVCQYLIGKYKEAIVSLKSGDGGALAHFYLAKLHFCLADCEAALQSYDMAQKAGYNADFCTLGRAETYRYMNQFERSLDELNRLSGAVEQTAEYLYQRGATVAAIGINPNEAIALYERAVAVDKNHPGALFGLALENERRGNDDDALELYKRAVGHFPTNIGTLFNLGILYEDIGQFEQAVICFQRIVDAEPMNKRAQLFLKDSKASNDMHFDEEAQRRRDQMSQILNLPVSDFELSVRSRNCLKTMGINSLADLCKHTEQDLLGSKNFGETSLDEIRNMLALKGLRLGQLASEKHVQETVEIETLSPDEQATLARPVSDLNLSVRARKCMNRLGIQTIGELVRRTADELLECKNFGVTSLKEIREKLTVYNIKLRGE